MEEAFLLFACRVESWLSFDRRPSRLRGTNQGSASPTPRDIFYGKATALPADTACTTISWELGDSAR
jgi:hypothetical protein